RTARSAGRSRLAEGDAIAAKDLDQLPRQKNVFAKAYEIAAAFTYPVIVSMRFFDDRVECSIGSFIVVNDEGWVITAAHLIEPASAHQRHQKEIAARAVQVRAIEEGPGTPAGKAKRI